MSGFLPRLLGNFGAVSPIMDIARPFVPRKGKIEGGLALGLQVVVANGGGAPVNVTPAEILANILATVNTATSGGPVCSGMPAIDLWPHAVRRRLADSDELDDLFRPTAVPAGGNVTLGVDVLVPFADLRGKTKYFPDGCQGGDQLTDYQFQAADLGAGLLAGLTVTSWTGQLQALEIPCDVPYLGATPTYRRFGITDSTQRAEVGRPVDVALAGAALGAQNIQILRAGELQLDFGTVDAAAGAAQLGDDPDHVVDPGVTNTWMILTRLDGELLSESADGRVEINNLTGAFPAGSRLVYSAIMPFAADAARFLAEYPGSQPFVPTRDGLVNLAEMAKNKGVTRYTALIAKV